MICCRPLPVDFPCRGLDVPRFCQLLDPSCPQHDPRYAEVIIRESPPRCSRPASSFRRQSRRRDPQSSLRSACSWEFSIDEA